MASSQLLSRDLCICCVSAVICALDVDAGTTLDAGLFINSAPSRICGRPGVPGEPAFVLTAARSFGICEVEQTWLIFNCR